MCKACWRLVFKANFLARMVFKLMFKFPLLEQRLVFHENQCFNFYLNIVSIRLECLASLTNNVSMFFKTFNYLSPGSVLSTASCDSWNCNSATTLEMMSGLHPPMLTPLLSTVAGDQLCYVESPYKYRPIPISSQ